MASLSISHIAFRILSFVLLAIVTLVSCTDTSPLQQHEQRITTSSEIRVRGKAVRGSSVDVEYIGSTLDTGMALIATVYHDGLYDVYRYPYGSQSTVTLPIPAWAVTIQLGIQYPKKLVTAGDVTLVVHDSHGSPVPGAIPRVIVFASSSESALQLAEVESIVNRSAEAYFEVLTNIRDEPEKSDSIVQVIETLARKYPVNLEVLRAAYVRTGRDSSSRYHSLMSYLEFVNTRGKIVFPEVFRSIIRNPAIGKLYDHEMTNGYLIPAISLERPWHVISQLAQPAAPYEYKTNVTTICKHFLDSLDRLSAYENVFLVSKLMWLADWAQETGDLNTSLSLLNHVKRYNDASQSACKHQPTGPTTIFDGSGWTQESMVRAVDIMMMLGQKDEALGVLLQYTPTTSSSISTDTAAFNRFLAYKSTLPATAIPTFIDKAKSISSKPKLMSLIERVINGAVAPTSRHDVVLVITSNTCSACKVVLRKVKADTSFVSNHQIPLVFYNVDKKAVEWSTARVSSLTPAILERYARSAPAYPTTYTLTNNRMSEQYDGSTYHLLARLTVKQ